MNKRRFVTNAILTLIMSVGIAGLASCKDKKPAEKKDLGEAGVYYTEADGREYLLSLGGNRYTLTLGNLVGDYEYDGKTLTLKGEGAPEVKADGDAFSITYGGGTYRFLKRVNYVVRFETDGGGEVADKAVINGKTVEKPVDPVKSGYDFIGWYKNGGFTELYDFESAPVTGDITLYARYAEKSGDGTEYRVRFVSDGETISEKSTIGGRVYDLPEVKKDGKTFEGWFISDYGDGARLTYRYDGRVLGSSATMYAVFSGDVPQVSVSEKEIKWRKSGISTDYSLEIAGSDGFKETWRGGQNSYAFDFSGKGAGEYVVTLSVSGNTSRAYYINKKLERVSVFGVHGNVLKYNGVKNAEKYVIEVEDGSSVGKRTIDNGLSGYFDFGSYEMRAGGIKFIVHAHAQGYVSSVSEAFYVDRTLESVSGLYVNEKSETLVWNAVKGAERYEITLTDGKGSETFYTDATNFSLKTFSGSVKAEVRALSRGYNPSARVSASYEKKTPATPSGFAIKGNLAVWKEVDGAEKYVVTVGDKEYETVSASFDLGGLEQADEYVVKVKAVGADGNGESLFTDEIKAVGAGVKDVVSYYGGKVRWIPAIGANYYQVRVNGRSYRVDGESEFAVKLTKAGYNDVEVRHNYGGNINTEWSKLTVYAYAVFYDVMGGKTVETEYKAVGDRMVLPVTLLTGYDFDGWYTARGGLKANGKKYQSETFDVAGDMTLYAGYIPKKFRVSLDLDGNGKFDAEPTEEQLSVSYMTGYSLPVPESVDGSKVFGGWFTEQDGQGLRYTDWHGESVGEWKDLSDKTLIASWVDMFVYHPIQGGKYYSVSASEIVKDASYLKVRPTYKGKQVTTVEGAAFLNARNLVTVDIPDTVLSVENTAFNGCSSLININVYDTDGEQTSGGEELEQGKYYSIDGVLFYDNEFNGREIKYYPRGRVGEYAVPDGTQTIPVSVFASSSIKSVFIPSSVTKINAAAFLRCSSLEEVKFDLSSDGAELRVDERAFDTCYRLKKITFPNRLNYIERSAFSGCTGLERTDIDGTNGRYTSKDGLLCNADGTEIIFAPVGFKGENGEYSIASGVRKIGESAFAGSMLKKVVIPGYVTEIKKGAFENCYIEEIIFEGGKNDPDLSIGEYAFSRDFFLKEVTLPENLKTLGKNAFSGNPYLKSVTVKSVGDVQFANGAFAATNGVTTLKIGADLGFVEINGIFGGAIENIEVSPENPNYSSDGEVLFDKEKTVIVYYPASKTGEYVIPSTVTKVGARVFAEKKISEITVSKNITEIGESAFEDCKNLAKVNFEARDGETDLTIGRRAFKGTALTEIDIPETVTEIGSSAFERTPLKTATIPSTVRKLGNYTLSGSLKSMDVFLLCDQLYSVKVADGNENFSTDECGIMYLKSDGQPVEVVYAPAKKAPDGIVTKTDADIPATVSVIREKVFTDNEWITSVKFNNENGITIGSGAFTRAYALSAVTLTSGFTEIPGSMFKSCYSLERITVPATVTKIGKAAFNACTALEAVEFEPRTADQPLTIEDGSYGSNGVFGDCFKLKNITLPETTTAIGAFAFTVYDERLMSGEDDLGLTEITVPHTVSKIGRGAFRGMSKTDDDTNTVTIKSGLKKVVFGKDASGKNSLTEIGRSAFENSAVTSFVLTEKVKEITESAFANTLYMTSFTVEDGSALTAIGKKAFYNSAVVSAEIPAGVETVGENTFGKCKDLADLTFLTDGGKASLKSTEKINAIGDGAFSETAIETFDFPATDAEGGTYKVGKELFRGCEKLETVNISASLVNVNEVFSGCTAIKSVTVDEENAHLTSKFDVGDSSPVIYNKSVEGITAIRHVYGQLPEEYGIPDGIAEIGERAFEGQRYLKKLTIPVSLKTVGNRAFESCLALERLDFVGGTEGSMLTSLGEDAFSGCVSLNDVVLPDSLTSIPRRAFKNCTGLKNLKFGKNTEFLGASAFENAGLVSIDIPVSLKRVGTGGGVYGGDGMSVFKNCVDLERVNLHSETEWIGVGAFEGCVSLKQIIIPDSVVRIMGKAFNGSGLVSVELPDGILLGGNPTRPISDETYASDNPEGVFRGCAALKEVKFKGEILYLTSNLFAKCGSLEKVEFVTEQGIVVNDIPDSVRLIGDSLFAETGITQMKIRKYIPKVGYYDKFGINLFKGCKNLTDVVLPADTQKIGMGWFSDCRSLENIGYFDENGDIVSNALPYGVTEIGDSALSDCVSLETLVLSENIDKIDNAFSGCVKYTGENGTFILPSKVTVISPRLLNNCKSIHTVVLHDGIKDGNLGDKYNKGYMTDGVSAFAGMDMLETLVLPLGSPYTIDENGFVFRGDVLVFALGGVSGEVVIPSTVREIGINAFAENKNVTKVYFGEGLETIYAGAFGGCENLTGEIVFPSTFKRIGAAMYGVRGAFENTGITSVRLPKGIRELNYGVESENVVAENAFKGCKRLSEVTIEDGVKEIGRFAFEGCTAISKIILPASVTDIGAGAFNGWTSEQTICFRATLEDVGNENLWKTKSDAVVVYGYTGD